jgi:hypothetical protein
VARRRGTAGLGKVDAFYGFYDVEEQRDSPSANEMMVKYGTDNKASMAGKGKALILGRVTDSLWVEVLRWAGLESWSQVEDRRLLEEDGGRLRESMATKAWCRATGRAPRWRHDRAITASGHLGHGSLGLGREAKRVEESCGGWVEGHGEEGNG